MTKPNAEAGINTLMENPIQKFKPLSGKAHTVYKVILDFINSQLEGLNNMLNVFLFSKYVMVQEIIQKKQKI